MKQHLNTLFVTTDGAYLAKEGEALLVRVEGATKLRVPIHTLGGVVCFGRVGVSPSLMGLCGERDVAISMLSTHGQFRARISGYTGGNVLLRRQQYRAADDPAASAAVARAVVAAKVANARSVLLRALRDNPGLASRAAVEAAARGMAGTLDQLQADAVLAARRAAGGPVRIAVGSGGAGGSGTAGDLGIDGVARPAAGPRAPADNTLDPHGGSGDPRFAELDTVRGREGEAANLYFGVFDHLIVAQKPAGTRAAAHDGPGSAAAVGTGGATGSESGAGDGGDGADGSDLTTSTDGGGGAGGRGGMTAGFAFRTRSRRPPLDPVNALLSFLYAMLGHDARAACEACGLDPQVGFLHRDRPGRAGLALDLMEEFRPYLADRLALSLINRRQVSPAGFETTESGAVRMTDATRKAVIAAYQKRKQEPVVHPYLDERVSAGLLVHLQARLLARHVRGELDAYPAFVWK